ncbi:hypothetical protein CAT7_00710 [Carnobacterium sp. AT7]|nr:hypothetical protein CAT7_00710 [Carnobacterium sp. AT7]
MDNSTIWKSFTNLISRLRIKLSLLKETSNFKKGLVSTLLAGALLAG